MARRLTRIDRFAADPTRGETMRVKAADLELDYSKNRLTAETIGLLCALARRAGLAERIEAMFVGQRINLTEGRAVLHVALRAPPDAVIEVDGTNVVPAVHQVRDRMDAFATAVRSGAWRGYTGKPIRNVVNIGIGGSDLGPAMAYEALAFGKTREEVEAEGVPAHQAPPELTHDSSSNALISSYRRTRGRS